MKSLISRFWWIGLLLVGAAVLLYFLLPFGLLPKAASPNCGPEHRRWLDVRPQNTADFMLYLRTHERELFTSGMVPRLDALPANNTFTMDVAVDYEQLAAQFQVEKRLGYTIYSLTYHPPACDPTQTYTLKITSLGIASLYGCCGV